MLFSLALALAAGAADSRPLSVRDLVMMKRVSDPRVSPDGTQVAFVLRTTDYEANAGRFDLWLALLDGSAARRLTVHEAADNQPRWAPDGRALFFVSTRSGSAQVHRLRLDGGEPEAVTSLPLDVDALEVAPGGKGLVLAMAVFPGATPQATAHRFAEKKKSKASGMLFDRLFVRHWDAWSDGTRNHLFYYDLATGKATDLMSQMDADAPSRPFGGGEEYDLTPDGRTLVFAARDAGREEAWSTNFDLHAVPVDGSAPPRRLTTNPAWDTQPRFSRDGRTLAYLAMSRPGYESDRFRIVLRDWAAGNERTLDLRADDSPNGDRSPGEIAWSRDGRELFAAADHLGQHAVFALDAASGRTRIVVAEGVNTAVQEAAGGRLLVSRTTHTMPAELFAASRDGRGLKPVTSVNAEALASIRFGAPEQFTFAGAHSATVYAYLVRPADFDAAKKYPVAFLIHGGPQGSFGNEFHYRWNPQVYAGAGYAAVLVDFTGSTGYGQAFTDRIRGDWGGAPYEDLMKGLDAALAKYPFLDGSKACALGASYGGYMVNWIAGQTDRFRCLVSHDGNLDERTAYYMTEELWFPEWEHGGPEWQHPAGFVKHNPIDGIPRWKTPTLVVHSARDYRVVDDQGLATFNALQRKGIPSQLLFFPDENHWVLKPQNSVQWHETVLAWLARWLK
jgi:dipeptidyl aminopeptidase/acylaminoacyl peptidase